jgi:hypothetical protein
MLEFEAGPIAECRRYIHMGLSTALYNSSLLSVDSADLFRAYYCVYVNYFNSLLSTVVRRFIGVLTCSACFYRVVSNRAKNPCISFINTLSCILFAEILLFQYYFWSVGRM